ncbi:MAG: hypothetical protein AAF602_24115 [Myxococcota bacterium]
MRRSLIVLALVIGCKNTGSSFNDSVCSLLPDSESDTPGGEVGFAAADAIATLEGPAQVDFVPADGGTLESRELSTSWLVDPLQVQAGEFSGPGGCLRGRGLTFEATVNAATGEGWLEAGGRLTVEALGATAEAIRVLGTLQVEPSAELREEMTSIAAAGCSGDGSDAELLLALTSGFETWDRRQGTLVVDYCDGVANDTLYTLEPSP